MKPGDKVQIKEGYCGAGFRFVVTKVQIWGKGEAGEFKMVWGGSYGPVRMSEVEVVRMAVKN